MPTGTLDATSCEPERLRRLTSQEPVPAGTRRYGEPWPVAGPRGEQVELPVDNVVAAVAGVGEVERDLGVLDPASGTDVLPLGLHTWGYGSSG